MSKFTHALNILDGTNSMVTGYELLTAGNAGADADADADEVLFAKLGLPDEFVQFERRRCAAIAFQCSARAIVRSGDSSLTDGKSA